MDNRKRRMGDRRDGTLLRDLDALHAFTPYLYPNRADNEAFIRETIDLTQVNAYLAKKNEAHAEEPYKLFHLILAALLKTVTLRPKMNRFIQGYRMYQRNRLTAAFVVKKKFQDEAHEALAFLDYGPDDTVDTLYTRIMAEIHQCRSEKLDNSSAGMDKLTKLPRWFLRIVMWILHKLDFYGHAPEFLVKTDPNYASVFVSNLGSIKLQAGYHHLCNWGTNSLFLTIGEIKPTPFYAQDGSCKVCDGLELGLTIDERIADGYYYAESVRLLRHLLLHPELLERPASEPVDYKGASKVHT